LATRGKDKGRKRPQESPELVEGPLEAPESTLPVVSGRNPDGTFPVGASGNPNGRPKGARNRITLARLLVEEQLRSDMAPQARKLLQKAIEMALEGNEKMLSLLVDKVLTTPKDAPDEGESGKDIKIIIQNLTGAAKTVTAGRPTQIIDATPTE